MHKELKKAIFDWLYNNQNEWQRSTTCRDVFRQYIYDPTGNYIIGGKEVSEFVEQAEKLLYGGGEKW